jgi:hypothetical protein
MIDAFHKCYKRPCFQTVAWIIGEVTNDQKLEAMTLAAPVAYFAMRPIDAHRVVFRSLF